MIGETVGQLVGFEAENGDIYFGDKVEVCVFFVSPENPDNDNHFRGEVKFVNGSVCIEITEYMVDDSGWKLLSENQRHFPFDADYIEDGKYTIPLFDLCSISGNNGEYLSDNVKIIGNIFQNKDLINQNK